MQQRFEQVAKEYSALMTTRHRALQRPLDKIEHLRHEERGLLDAEIPPLTFPELSAGAVTFAAVTQVTVLGGGQLGWMLGLAGMPLGLDFTFLDPSPDAPARARRPARRRRARRPGRRGEGRGGGARSSPTSGKACRPRPPDALALDVPVLPSARALEVSQDRVIEKETFRSLGIPTAPFRAVDDRATLDTAIARAGLARGA